MTDKKPTLFLGAAAFGGGGPFLYIVTSKLLLQFLLQEQALPTALPR